MSAYKISEPALGAVDTTDLILTEPGISICKGSAVKDCQLLNLLDSYHL